MARPLTASEALVQLTVRIPREVLAALHDLADKNERAFQTEVIRTLKWGLEARAKEHDPQGRSA